MMWEQLEPEILPLSVLDPSGEPVTGTPSILLII